LQIEVYFRYGIIRFRSIFLTSSRRERATSGRS